MWKRAIAGHFFLQRWDCIISTVNCKSYTNLGISHTQHLFSIYLHMLIFLCIYWWHIIFWITFMNSWRTLKVIAISIHSAAVIFTFPHYGMNRGALVYYVQANLKSSRLFMNQWDNHGQDEENAHRRCHRGTHWTIKERGMVSLPLKSPFQTTFVEQSLSIHTKMGKWPHEANRVCARFLHVFFSLAKR